MSQTHILATAKRTYRVTIVETAAAVTFTIRATRYGRLGDEIHFARWLQPIVARYDSDPRPIVIDDPHSGQRAIVVCA